MDNNMNILIVDDEKIVRESLFHWFTKLGHAVEKASSGFEALERLEKIPFDLLFVDMKMPEMNGLELLEKVKTEYPETTVIIITAYGSIESAVKAMKLGASDYLLKPFKPEYLSLVMEKVTQQIKLSSEYNYLKSRLEKITRYDDIIGQGPAMSKIFELIPEVARSDSSILLVGETGTGKELVAKAIHAKSNRSYFPFIPINCGAIPDSLLESELFGHQKGAFTGATHSRKGFLEVVSGGTLFLDEIGEVSAKMQIDLLRVLEEKKITRIGDCNPVTVDFRLISATRRDLEQEIAAGNFREDFFYRINVITIHIPPLRERKEDIPLLVEHFLEKYSHETTKRVDHVTRDAVQRLSAYEWPGNVRELENVIERAVVLSKSRTLDLQDFSFLQTSPLIPSKLMSLRQMEKQYIRRILEECGWNITKAAKILDINRVTLHKKIKRFEMQKNP
jgi:two-component system response regulator HydG